REPIHLVGGNKVHGAPAKAAASQTRAVTAGLFRCKIDEHIDLLARGLEIVAEAYVCLMHQLPEPREVVIAEGLHSREHAVVLSDDVTAAAKHVGLHLAAPAGEVVQRGVAECLDLRPVGPKNR